MGIERPSIPQRPAAGHRHRFVFVCFQCVQVKIETNRSISAKLRGPEDAVATLSPYTRFVYKRVASHRPRLPAPFTCTTDDGAAECEAPRPVPEAPAGGEGDETGVVEVRLSLRQFAYEVISITEKNDHGHCVTGSPRVRFSPR